MEEKETTEGGRRKKILIIGHDTGYHKHLNDRLHDKIKSLSEEVQRTDFVIPIKPYNYELPTSPEGTSRASRRNKKPKNRSKRKN